MNTENDDGKRNKQMKEEPDRVRENVMGDDDDGRVRLRMRRLRMRKKKRGGREGNYDEEAEEERRTKVFNRKQQLPLI